MSADPVIEPQLDPEEVSRNKVREICAPFVLDNDRLRKVKDLFLQEIKMGLCKSMNARAAVKCWITYVQSLPTGCETGKFLALDLGGTNFRVLCINLAENKFEQESQTFEIPDHILVGPGKDLFDHIAECLAKFLKSANLTDLEEFPLGFTFSFPVNQRDLDHGELVAWTKGFNCPGVIGRDVVDLLREAIDRRGDIKIKVFALLNDTTGTLMSCAWKNRNCKIGLIVGTGCNACYMEQLKYLNTYVPEPDNRIPTMIINTEWGAFGDNNGTLEFLRTDYDKEIDEVTHNRCHQLFEKMVSGMYLGELARKLMLACCKEGALFKGNDSIQLRTEHSFKTKHISDIESENRGTYTNCRTILEEMGYQNPSDADCENVRYICECVSRRSAHLVATNLACLIDRIGDPYVVVGIDGSVYRFHPHYHNLLTEKIKELARPECKFDLMLSEDGSGRGAALVAAVSYSRTNKLRAKLDKQQADSKPVG